MIPFWFTAQHSKGCCCCRGPFKTLSTWIASMPAIASLIMQPILTDGLDTRLPFSSDGEIYHKQARLFEPVLPSRTGLIGGLTGLTGLSGFPWLPLTASTTAATTPPLTTPATPAALTPAFLTLLLLAVSVAHCQSRRR